MKTILKALGGVALGVAAYTLGEIVQEKRAKKGEEYGVLDLFDEWIDEEDVSKEQSQMTKKQIKKDRKSPDEGSLS
ncbi:hypothetical protein [Helicobacter pametensis]|uniref:hypothetical protein n=1 Tax=Helicobacter pametensis TaxID=95149 RepID=UPI00047FB8A6|nr:hypothetical protein [Helicobacter pametensis]